jgi:hypothetical protein
MNILSAIANQQCPAQNCTGVMVENTRQKTEADHAAG